MRTDVSRVRYLSWKTKLTIPMSKTTAVAIRTEAELLERVAQSRLECLVLSGRRQASPVAYIGDMVLIQMQLYIFGIRVYTNSLTLATRAQWQE